MMKKIIGAITLILLTFSCLPQNGAEGLIAGNIYWGQEASEGQWDSVVALTNQHGQFCSGVLLSKKVVLTAGHCIRDYESPEQIRVYYGPGQLEDYTGSVEVEFMEPHPGYNYSVAKDEYDFAYLILKQEIDGIKLISPLENFSRVMKKGKEVTLAGYGQSETWESGIKRYVDTTVTELRDLNFKNESYVQDGSFFRKPKTSCSGDSGGPAFMKVGRNYYLVGIASTSFMPFGSGWVSAGGRECQGHNIYGRIDIAMEWLSTTLAAEYF